MFLFEDETMDAGATDGGTPASTDDTVAAMPAEETEETPTEEAQA